MKLSNPLLKPSTLVTISVSDGNEFHRFSVYSFQYQEEYIKPPSTLHRDHTDINVIIPPLEGSLPPLLICIELTMPRRGCFRTDWRSRLFLSKGFLMVAMLSGKKVKTCSCWRTLLCSSWKMAIRFPSLPTTCSS